MEFSDLEFGSYFTKGSSGKIFRKIVNKRIKGEKSKPTYYTVKFGKHNMSIDVNCVEPSGRLIYMDVTTKIELAEGNI